MLIVDGRLKTTHSFSETSNGAQSNTGASSTPTTPTVSIKQAHGSGAPSASNLRVSSGYKAVNQSSPSAKAPGSTSASLQTANPTVTNTKITPKVSVAGSVNSAPVVTGGVSTPAAPPQITAIPGANNQTLPQSAGEHNSVTLTTLRGVAVRLMQKVGFVTLRIISTP